MAKAANSERQWVIAYDIELPRQRVRVARYLEARATRIQKSVFTSTCTQYEAVALLRELEKHVGPNDLLVMWPILARAVFAPPRNAVTRSPSLPPYWIA